MVKKLCQDYSKRPHINTFGVGALTIYDFWCFVPLGSDFERVLYICGWLLYDPSLAEICKFESNCGFFWLEFKEQIARLQVSVHHDNLVFFSSIRLANAMQLV